MKTFNFDIKNFNSFHDWRQSRNIQANKFYIFQGLKSILFKLIRELYRDDGLIA